MVSLDPVRGHEQGGTRPALVLSSDELNASGAGLVVILPITTRDKRIRMHVPVPKGQAGLSRASFIKCEDVRSISTQRLSGRLGLLPPEQMGAVERAMRFLLGL